MRVPSYGEILSPAFNQEGRFEAADFLIHERISELCDLGVIHGAVLFGSASFGDENQGSDRDMIVAYPGPIYETEFQALDALHGVATEVYRSTSIPLEITCATLEEFREGEHTITGSMLAWLRAQPDQFPDDVIGNEFLDIIAAQRRPLRTDFTDLESWLARTHHVLQKEYLQGHYFRPHDLLGQILSAPHVAARKTIDALRSNGFEAGLLDDLTKSGIASSLFEMYDRERAVSCRLYDQVTHDARLFYGSFLPESSGLSQDEYDQIIEAEIDVNLPKVIHLLSRLQMIQRCTRAHLRLRFVPYEEDGIISFTDGDEDKHNLPFLPQYLRDYMRPCDLNGQGLLATQ